MHEGWPGRIEPSDRGVNGRWPAEYGPEASNGPIERLWRRLSDNTAVRRATVAAAPITTVTRLVQVLRRPPSSEIVR